MSKIFDYYLPQIKIAIKQYYANESLDFIDNFHDFIQISNFVKTDIKILQKFMTLIEPDMYMVTVYEYLYLNHVATYKQLIDWYSEFYNTSNNDQGTIRNAIRRKINVLNTFDIIDMQLKDYGSRFPAHIFIVKQPDKSKLDKAFKIHNIFVEVANKRNKRVVENLYPKKEKEVKIEQCYDMGCKEPQQNEEFCNLHYKIYRKVKA